jgi:D-beta-D-heptose 7-phosphate kinase/D-beta-D-heptose 1-phosphate adenosyltransferase
MKQIHERLRQAIDRFDQVRILVVGDIMLDVFEFCYSQHSKPIDSEKPGKRAYKSHKTIKVLGGAGNVAANLASLNIKASLVGLSGNDEHYFKLRELADEHGIAHCLIRDASRPTTVKARLYVDNDYLLRRDDEETHKADAQISATLVNEVIRELSNCDVVILSDYDKGVFTAENAQQILRECQMHSIPVVVDFKPANRAYFCGADIMAPNEQEARRLVPDFDATSPEAGLKQLHTMLGSKNVIVTLGAKGMCGYDGSSTFSIAGNQVQAVDAVGCGDTVRAALAIGLALGLNLQDAATLANDAAAVIVQKPATAAMTIDELRSFVDEKY